MSKFTHVIRFTIGTKLVGLLATLLMGSIVTLMWLSTQLFVDSDTALIQQANSDTAAGLASQMREAFQTLTEKMRLLGTLLIQAGTHKTTQETLIREYFASDPDFLGTFLVKIESTPKGDSFSLISKALSPQVESLQDPQGERSFKLIQKDPDISAANIKKGESQVSSFQLPNGESAVSIAVPFLQDPRNPAVFTHFLISFIKQHRFVKAFTESNGLTSFMIDQSGKLLAHPNSEWVNRRENLSYLPIVKQMLEGKFNNGQTKYVNPKTGESNLGAFRLVGFGGLGVVAEVLEARAFEGARKVQYRAGLVAWIILCLAFMTGYLYSGTITWPISQLVLAAKRIAEGDFHINLKPRGRDELANLSLAFNEMAKGLEERDRVKETFNKFHNKEIAEKLLSGEVKLGGERKEATVFFSDVRGFTSLSESMQPEQVVEMLNEYMTSMVAIIRSNLGVVDKYVGDAIMALWGVPISTENDSYNAVKACLEMRAGLAKLNEIRIARGQPVLKIGMGVNRGPLIAGNIGSDEKMEYTVIGDAVNLASRIESMTKEYGTDLLISGQIYEMVKDKFICEAAGSSKVKGKTEAIHVYKVSGYYNEQGQPVIVETPYSSYAAEKSDKVVHEDGHDSEGEEAQEAPAEESEEEESSPTSSAIL